MNSDRLERIIELAKRGLGGEQESALAMLKKHCENNNITIEELLSDDQPKENREFKLPARNKEAEKLFWQICGKVLQSSRFNHWKYRNRVGLLLTKYEYEQIKFLFDIYLRAYEKEKQKFYLAFLIKHNIFAPRTEDAPEPTEQERKEYWDAKMMSKGISKVRELAIEHKKG